VSYELKGAGIWRGGGGPLISGAVRWAYLSGLVIKVDPRLATSPNQVPTMAPEGRALRTLTAGALKRFRNSKAEMNELKARAEAAHH